MGKILKWSEFINESLPNEKSLEQLKKVMNISKKTDIGNRISDMNKEGSNIQYIRNPINNAESREEYDMKNKDFVPSWNLKGLLTPYRKNKKKRK
jgi:hypothetical protein